MTAHEKSGRNVNKLIPNLFLADHNHFVTAFLAVPVFRFTKHFFHGKIFKKLPVRAFCFACMFFHDNFTLGMRTRCYGLRYIEKRNLFGLPITISVFSLF